MSRNNINPYNCLGLSFRQQKRYKDRIRWRDRYTCQLCGKPGYDVDHILPFHISHDSSPSNLRVLCHACNLKNREVALPEGKHRRIPIDQWEAYIKTELAKLQA